MMNEGNTIPQFISSNEKRSGQNWYNIQFTFFLSKERELESNPLTDYVDLIWFGNQNLPSRYLTLFDKITNSSYL